jgi:hypothetical protein
VSKTIYKALTVKDVLNEREFIQLQSNKIIKDWTTPVLKTKMIGQPALLRLKKKVCIALLPLKI